MALCWHRHALEDLRGIHDYLAQKSLAAAKHVVGTICDQADIPCEHPAIGRPGRLEGTRELVVSRYPHIVAYREKGADVEILLVVHTSRLWPEQPP